MSKNPAPGTPGRVAFAVGQAKYHKKRTIENRERIATMKEEAGCKDCGNRDRRVLQYHHRDGTEKLDVIGRLVSSRRSWGTIQAEIDKCDVLCANCHAIRHYRPGIADVKIERTTARLGASPG